MRAYLAKLSLKWGLLLALPIFALAYSLVTIVLPAILHALVPEFVRSLLRLM